MKFYGDTVRWFVGTVIAPDPEERGRFKVRIAGLHSPSVEDEYLPYAETVIPTTEGGVSGIGKIPQLQNGAFVYGMFLDGKQSQSPLILGSITHDEFPSSVQKANFSGEGKSSGSVKYTPPKHGDPSSYPVVKISNDIKTLYADGAADTDTRRMIIMQHLINNGLSITAAAGVTGNLEHESTFDPLARYTTSTEDSYGLAQWNDKVGRLQPLKDYASSLNPPQPWEDFLVQLNFLIVDMKSNAWERHRVWSHLSDRNKTLDFEGGKVNSNATYFFLHNFEIGDESSLSKREKNAYVAYHQWLKSNAAAVKNRYGV